jgi:hypothetical protein
MMADLRARVDYIESSFKTECDETETQINAIEQALAATALANKARGQSSANTRRLVQISRKIDGVILMSAGALMFWGGIVFLDTHPMEDILHARIVQLLVIPGMGTIVLGALVLCNLERPFLSSTAQLIGHALRLKIRSGD